MSAQEKPANLLQQLRDFPLFAGVKDSALQWLIDHSRYRCYAKDDYVFREGDPTDHMQIILEGSFLIRREKGGRKRELGVWEAPYVTGVLPFSRMTHAGADGLALETACLLELHRDLFVEMVNVSYTLVQALVGAMTDRVRDFQQIRLMDEKLLALGKMSAGLAHELNNPASAIVRSSQALHKHLAQTPVRFKQLVTMRVDADAVDEVNRVLFDRIQARSDTSELTLMQREALGDELLDWLEDHDIPQADDLIDTFIDWDFHPGHLDAIAEAIPPEALAPVIWWIDTSLTTESLVSEIQTASGRIAELISSIKTYSHMDSEPSMEFIDVSEGLKSTLTMLKFRFKQKNVSLNKETQPNLPNIKALAGELNQVWTNLIANALDALPADGTGKISVRTYQLRDNLCVDIEDNGSGIPADIQSQIFDPFFTTKGVGEGTGMGLDIVQRVLKRHGGTVGVESQPGRTCFRVCFPL
ncbi:ATP-binding protein [Neolewinella lacunae]|uniref:histidine kinase n=1 Tax=Neolewinella lacunae TaxID=1517758 RepID=A0A923PLC1_9BACT|nr:ATP-binding protein [Neolewinella lacunae]MBC6995504.1 cyclic nucleotide-binding domain-containing protein [Neolewinella lacunae]MDN3635092.1 ATP-binding protein [Neolewinella lacunae]